MRWIYKKIVNICGICSSLEEAFEFFWSSFTEKKNFTIFDLEKHKIEQIYIWNPMTSWLIYYVTLSTLIFIISMDFQSLRHKHPSGWNIPSSEERGGRAVFAGYLTPSHLAGLFFQMHPLWTFIHGVETSISMWMESLIGQKQAMFSVFFLWITVDGWGTNAD